MCKKKKERITVNKLEFFGNSPAIGLFDLEAIKYCIDGVKSYVGFFDSNGIYSLHVSNLPLDELFMKVVCDKEKTDELLKTTRIDKQSALFLSSIYDELVKAVEKLSYKHVNCADRLLLNLIENECRKFKSLQKHEQKRKIDGNFMDNLGISGDNHE